MFNLVIAFFCYYFIHHSHLYMYVYTIIYPPIIESGGAHRNEFTSAIRFRCFGWFISYVKGRTNETNRHKTLFFSSSENRTMESWRKSSEHKVFLLHWYLCERGSSKDVGLPYAHLFAIFALYCHSHAILVLYTRCVIAMAFILLLNLVLFCI